MGGLVAGVVVGAGAFAALALDREQRLHLEGAADQEERAAIARYYGVALACVVAFAVALPLAAFFLKLRWLYVGSFGLYALALSLAQRLLLPASVILRVRTLPGGRVGLAVGQAVGVLAGLGLLAFAAWLLASAGAGRPG